MTKRSWFVLCAALVAAIPAMVRGQGEKYPVTVVAPGRGPYTFAPDYQTPWDRIQIMVTARMSPNLFVRTVRKASIPRTPKRRAGGSWCSSDLMVC